MHPLIVVNKLLGHYILHLTLTHLVDELALLIHGMGQFYSYNSLLFNQAYLKWQFLKYVLSIIKPNGKRERERVKFN